MSAKKKCKLSFIIVSSFLSANPKPLPVLLYPQTMLLYSKPSQLEPTRAFKHQHQHKTCFSNGIPVVDLSNPNAKALVVKACEEHGFFKVINHALPIELVSTLESEAVKFFSLPQLEKDRADPANPFGYGNKNIGPNGDVGWIEYLLFRNTNLGSASSKLLNSFRENPDFFRSVVKSYIASVKNLATQVLRLLADGLMIKQRNVFSRLLEDEESDSIFRINHYPPCPNHTRDIVGFGEHTDPQVISVLRSNNITGLQIADKDGSWIPVPPDQHSFFINVGDMLQVMSNGRFKSVKHRVIQNSMKSRVSMIYFGGPPLRERMAPLPSLLTEGEESLYKEFTWSDYKNSAYKSRLADNRLCNYEKQLHYNDKNHNYI